MCYVQILCQPLKRAGGIGEAWWYLNTFFSYLNLVICLFSPWSFWLSGLQSNFLFWHFNMNICESAITYQGSMARTYLNIYNLDKRWKFIIQRKCVHIKAELICVFVLKNQQSRDDYCPVYQVLNLISWLNTVCHCLHFSDARTFWNKSLIFEKWWMLKILN